MKKRINTIEMAYDDVGKGTAVLWIHGYPLDRTIWNGQTVALSDVARHIVPDLRGYGESDAPEGAYSMDQYADDLRGLLDALGVQKVVLAGLSMGGYIAFAFIRKYPDRVAGLILADTRAGADAPEGAQGRRDNAAKALREGVKPVVEPMIGKLLAASTQAEQPAVVESVRKLLLSSRPHGVAGALLAMANRPDSTPTLAKIAVPTLIVVGAEDTLTPPSESKKLAEAIRGAKLVEIPRAGHLSNLEQPEAFNRPVRDFLDGLSRR